MPPLRRAASSLYSAAALPCRSRAPPAAASICWCGAPLEQAATPRSFPVMRWSHLTDSLDQRGTGMPPPMRRSRWPADVTGGALPVETQSCRLQAVVVRRPLRSRLLPASPTLVRTSTRSPRPPLLFPHRVIISSSPEPLNHHRPRAPVHQVRSEPEKEARTREGRRS
jgi:hypothetical protein